MTKDELNVLADFMLERNFKFMPSKRALSVCVNDAFDTQIIGIVNSEGMITAGEIREQANRDD